METDNHYFLEGLFIVVLSVAAAFFAIWLGHSGHRDDVLYRIHFAESVSGLSLGDPVKFHGVDVGTVKAMSIDPENSRLVLVDVRLRKDAPVKTDTRASLHLKGITGVIFIELNGGSPSAQMLTAATPSDQVPEIPSEPSELATLLDQLPKVLERFSTIENKTSKVLGDVGEFTDKVKENPSLLLRRPKNQDK
ncbi:MAG: MCE family protein [Burkholderiaceae bacterium]|nr:MAG: MCE family protein [Burkholderiaceae bacterium]